MGVSSDGLAAAVQPEARAGAPFQSAGIYRGQPTTSDGDRPRPPCD